MKGILRNWNFMRFFRLAIGIAIIVQSVISRDWVIGVMGVLFTCMPIFNVGCCGVGGCANPVIKNTGIKKDVSYEEVD
ncbi:MAG: hypothetical protein ABI760_12500 [Ferruginibacter sp.]